MRVRILFKAILMSVLFIGITGIFWGCVKSNTAPPIPTANSIANTIESANNLSILNYAMQKAGLESTLTNDGPFTYFIATDAAFEAAGITDSLINALPDSVVSKIVMYSAIAGQLNSVQLPPGPDASQLTATGDSVFITNVGNGNIYVNGIQLVEANQLASNGIIHVLNLPLLPATGNLLQIAQADTSFSLFSAAVARTAAGSSNMATVLSGPNIYTLFLPLNSAFRAAGYTTVTDINNANPDSLARIIKYNIMPRRFFTSDFIGGSQQSTLLTGSTITLGTIGGVTYGAQGNSNTSTALITSANIMAYNGVIQVIDQVLLP